VRPLLGGLTAWENAGGAMAKPEVKKNDKPKS
jgi:hypothetical protein